MPPYNSLFVLADLLSNPTYLPHRGLSDVTGAVTMETSYSSSDDGGTFEEQVNKEVKTARQLQSGATSGAT